MVMASCSNKPSSIRILAFETARIMSRLVSLYKSLSDVEIKKLKNDVVKSKGVSYLNSNDEYYLLNLACLEKSEDLNRIVITVSRLSQRCIDPYVPDMGKLEYGSKGMEKVVQKMERYIQATANLYTTIVGLNEMEISERNLQLWKNKQEHAKPSHANYELFEENIANQRKQVEHYKATSLWSKSFDMCVELMSQTIFVVHARLSIVFAQPQSSTNKDFCLISDRDKYVKDYCLISEKDMYVRKPNSKNVSRAKHVSNSGPTLLYNSNIKGITNLASPSTVGGAGLAYRYANVIITAECCLYSLTSISEEARTELYEMLPENVKLRVKAKLKKKEYRHMHVGEGWRDAIEEIMGWLGPVAHDTMQRQNEKNFERQRFDGKPACALLLMQTLHFADLDKTEAAIVEVLVGLSCMYRFERY